MPTKKELTEQQLNAMLHTKIEECAMAIGHQDKQGHNSHSNYNFTSNEQMMAAVRAAWPNHGISVVCDVCSFSEREFDNGRGKIVIRSTVELCITITDLETGHQIQSKFVGSENCTQGKSMQKAITSGFKYWIFKNFKVSSQMEVDPDGKNEEIEPEDPTATAIYELENAKDLNTLKGLWTKYQKLGPAVLEAKEKRKKQLSNG